MQNKESNPGGSVLKKKKKKNPPANEGDTGSIPDLGRSHMPWNNQADGSQLLSLRSREGELERLSPPELEPVLCQERGCRQPDAPDWQLERSPRLLQLEKSPCSSEDPAQPK